MRLFLKRTAHAQLTQFAWKLQDAQRESACNAPELPQTVVKTKVSSGEYASEREVIRDGLRALQARDKAVENWLRGEVAPAYDAMKADPSRGRSVADVRASLTAEHTRAVKAR